jgi:hypothetical protein
VQTPDLSLTLSSIQNRRRTDQRNATDCQHDPYRGDVQLPLWCALRTQVGRRAMSENLPTGDNYLTF